MDPEATFQELLDAVANRDWDQIEELASNLLHWMNGGGLPMVRKDNS